MGWRVLIFLTFDSSRRLLSVVGAHTAFVRCSQRSCRFGPAISGSAGVFVRSVVLYVA